MAESTRSRAGALTWPSLRTRDTVLTPTPARCATSAIVAPRVAGLSLVRPIRSTIYSAAPARLVSACEAPLPPRRAGRAAGDRSARGRRLHRSRAVRAPADVGHARGHGAMDPARERAGDQLPRRLRDRRQDAGLRRAAQPPAHGPAGDRACPTAHRRSRTTRRRTASTRAPTRRARSCRPARSSSSRATAPTRSRSRSAPGPATATTAWPGRRGAARSPSACWWRRCWSASR